VPIDEEKPPFAAPTEADKRRYAEQTWFATTTGALNGLLLNGMKSIAYPGFVKLVSLGISLYAINVSPDGSTKTPLGAQSVKRLTTPLWLHPARCKLCEGL
jgi:hypothetical protein